MRGAVDVRLIGLYELEPLGGSADDGHNSLSLHVLDPLHVLEEMPAIGAPPAAAVRTDYIEAAELPQIAWRWGRSCLKWPGSRGEKLTNN